MRIKPMSEETNISENARLTTPPESEPGRQFYFMDLCKELVGKIFDNTPTYHIVTFGCQMNFRDSEKFAGVLEAIGFKYVDNENADFVLYNTCTVRENASTRVYGRIGYLGKLKKEKNPGMIISLCGCMMQEPDEVEKIKKSYPFTDLLFGTHNSYKLAELLYDVLDGRLKRRLAGRKEHFLKTEILNSCDLIVEDLPIKYQSDFKAGVNITYGCDKFCTFCIVPYVRGREKSRKPEDIEAEVRNLVKSGVKEIMLLGQNVNSYGKGLAVPCNFAMLLERLSVIEGLQRIRFMTPYPSDFSDDVIDVIKRHDNICKHIHLPLQSGSTPLLKKMNRRYTKDEFLAIAGKIRERLEGVSITTDIIVGFPGETDEDFEETLDVCRKVCFDSAFTFIYSKRTGTPAASFKGEVPDDVVKERFEALLKVVGECSAKRTAMLTGKTVPVLVESFGHDEGHDMAPCSNNHSVLLTGRLENNTLVHFFGRPEMIGEILDVRLDECKDFYYYGTLV